MSTRVTNSTIRDSTLANLQANLATMAKLQEQLSSGKKINQPSDDPTGTVNALHLRQSLRLNDQYARNITDGTSWLNQTDTALQTTSSQLQAARNAATTALNASNQSPSSLAALGLEVDGVRKTVLSLANTTYNGRYVFAGTTGGPAVQAGSAGSEPYVWATAGAAPTDPAADGTGVLRQVDSTTTVRVDTDGRSVFGVDQHSTPASPATDTDSVFTVLANMQQHMVGLGSSDPAAAAAAATALRKDMDALDGFSDKVGQALASVGARETRLSQAQDATLDAKLSLTTSLGGVEDADLPATIIALQSQQVAYQAALGATAKVLQPSLMDFLK